MPSLQELLAQKAELDKAIAETQRAERTQAVAKVRALMAEHGLKVADLSTRVPAAPRPTKELATRKAPIKFRNTATGDVWSGRGAQPKWLREQLSKGRKLADFVV